MKKAFDLLNELGLSYEFYDYKKQAIDTTSVNAWLDEKGADIILNKKGTTWKKLTEEEQQNALASQDNLVTALTTHSSMIKRPVLQTAQGLIVGFDEAAYRALK